MIEEALLGSDFLRQIEVALERVGIEKMLGRLYQCDPLVFKEANRLLKKAAHGYVIGSNRDELPARRFSVIQLPVLACSLLTRQ